MNDNFDKKHDDAYDKLGEKLEKALPEDWPTKKGAPEFWEELGKTVASFAVLEDIVARVLVAITGSSEYEDEELNKEDVHGMMGQLNAGLGQPVYDNLAFLIDRLEETPFPDEKNFGPMRAELVRRMRLVNPWRHAISRGVWVGFETGLGPVRMKYVRRTRDGLEGFSDIMSRDDLVGIRRNVNLVTDCLLVTMQMQKIKLPDIGP